MEQFPRNIRLSAGINPDLQNIVRKGNDRHICILDKYIEGRILCVPVRGFPGVDAPERTGCILSDNFGCLVDEGYYRFISERLPRAADTYIPVNNPFIFTDTLGILLVPDTNESL